MNREELPESFIQLYFIHKFDRFYKLQEQKG